MKKLFTLLIATAIGTLLCFSLVSCGECEHTYGEWITDRAATESEVGERHRECTKCGEVVTTAIPRLTHTHTYAEAWLSDSMYHWHGSTCKHESAISSKEEHLFANGKCTVCGKVQSLRYALSGDEKYYIVSGIGNITDTAIIIPKMYKNLPVRKINASAFANCASLSSIVIPDSIDSIGNSAFAGCTNLSSIFVPDFVTSIGDSAFAGCTNLSSITLSDNITNIGNHTFAKCKALTKITVPSKVKTIHWNAFGECSALAEVTLPNGLTTIEGRAFHSCAQLRYIKIPNSVTEIGYYALYGCKNLESIELPFAGKSAESGGNGKFAFIFGWDIPERLKKVTLTSASVINDSAFNGCPENMTLYLSSTVQCIKHNAFYGCRNLMILFEGTKEEWDKIEKEAEWNANAEYVIQYSK